MALDDDALQLDNQVCFALAVCARAVIGLYRPLLEPLGLTHPQYLVMLTLWERSPRSVRELAETLQQEPATLSPLLKRLEQADLVTRTRNGDDERQLAVGLTDKGRQLREQALRIPPAIVERLGMNLDELAHLRETLHDVIDATR